MPKFKTRSGKTVDLNQNNFKAQGGEGKIHIIGDTVYKVCEPGKMIPKKKINELNVLDHPKIIRPEDILLDSKDKVVGYTMKLVPDNAVPLAQILTRTYRDREGVTPQCMNELVKQIADGIRFIHKKPGYLQVDGNEFNYMVTGNHDHVYFIDVNSFQTPSFPATAIMPSIRDWNCPLDNTTKLHQWNHMTDWYSFAIIAWYMFTGIHPFKGSHPKFPNMKTGMMDRMKAGISVLDPDSGFPKAAVYFPFESVIPGGTNGAYMQWFKAVFTQNKRLPAPADFQAAIAFVTNVREIIGSNNFDITMLKDYMSQITGFYEHNGKEVVVTTDHIYVNNQQYPKINAKFRIGFTTTTHTPVALVLDGSTAKLFNFETQSWIGEPFAAENIMSCDGRLYIHNASNIFELTFMEQSGGRIVPMQKSVANVMPYATQMFQGVVFQDMFGARMVSIFPESGHHYQFKIDVLSGLKITEAKVEKNVLMAMAMDKDGQYSRFVFRFSKDWSSYDTRQIEDITPTGLNFTVLENGMVVAINEEEKVEIFSGRKDSTELKLIADPAIKGNMRLCHGASQVKFAHGTNMHNITMKKSP